MDTIAPLRSPSEQLPPRLRETIADLLFSSPSWPISKCEAMLINLLRYATVQQLALEEGGQCAKLAIPNLLKIYRADRQWQQVCCYQTLHTCIRLLCALGILQKQRIAGQPTSYLLPLDSNYRFEATSSIVAALDRLCDPMCTKNLKMRKKASEVKLRLLRMSPRMPQNKACENRRDFPLSLSVQQRICRLVDSLGLSASVVGLLFEGITEICTEVVGRQHESPVFVDSARMKPQGVEAGDSFESRKTSLTNRRSLRNESPGEHMQQEGIARTVNLLAGDSSLVFSEESPGQAPLGDSFPQTLNRESPKDHLLGDSSPDAPRTESPSENTAVDSMQVWPEQKKVSFEHEERQESPIHAQNLRGARPSSIDSFPQKDSFRKNIELESGSDEAWNESEEALHQEALRYLRLFDGPQYATVEYVQTHAGKKALGGYSNKIRRSPRLARMSAINTLLQQTFYDLSKQKKPLESAGKWFHASFDRYIDVERPMEITGEILDWAKSSYTLEEIARIVPLERKRQEAQWQSPERLHRPFSSCTHGVRLPSPQSSSEVQSKGAQGDAWSIPPALPLPQPAQAMDQREAEQLAQEIREQASWYLEQAHARREPTLGEHAYVAEATVVGLTLSHMYACRADWWQEHQEQMTYQNWERQFEERERCGTHST